MKPDDQDAEREMDPKQLFSDERFNGICVYCGEREANDDHVPSKILLDDPFPDNLPKVPACEVCNNRFSVDEPYLACLVECALTNSVDPAVVSREKVRRILTKRPHFGTQILAGRREDGSGNLLWVPDEVRVRNVLLKLVRGHAAYELAEPRLDEPENLWFAPLCALSPGERQDFETAPGETVWPEIGSRAFLQSVVVGQEVFLEQGWTVLQQGRYRYLVSYSGGTMVRVVLSEYLACEAIW